MSRVFGCLWPRWTVFSFSCQRNNQRWRDRVGTCRQFQRSLCEPRARGKRCVPLARHGTAHPARARFWQWKVFWGARDAGKLVAALLEKAKPLSRLKRKSAAVAIGGVFGHQRLDDFDNLLLLRAGQLRHRFKYAPDFPDGTAARLWRCDAVKLLDGNVEHLCQLFDLLRA